MKIEAGKMYKTRDGHLVRIYATDGSGLYPVHGAILRECEWRVEEWTAEGSYIEGRDEIRLDIVESVDERGLLA